jgi:flagellar FliL protein
MAKQEQMDKGLDTSVIPEPKKTAVNPKILLIGLPLFVVQLVIVYFVTANILLSKIQNHNQPASQVTEASTVEGGQEGQPGEGGGAAGADTVELGKNLYSMKDIIVNPAGTNGARYLLVDISFDFPTADQMEKFKNKEILAKDIIISTLSAKSLGQLSSIAYKDSIKTELINRIESGIPKTKVNTAYFSRYIIQ